MRLERRDRVALCGLGVAILATIPIQLAAPRSIVYGPDTDATADAIVTVNVAGAMGTLLIALSCYANAVSVRSDASSMAVTYRTSMRLAGYASLATLALALVAADVGWVATGGGAAPHNRRIPVPTMLVNALLPCSGVLTFSGLVEQFTGAPSVTPAQVLQLFALRSVTLVLMLLPRAWPEVQGLWALYLAELVYLAVSNSIWRATLDAHAALINRPLSRVVYIALISVGFVLLEGVISILYILGLVSHVTVEATNVGLVVYR